MQIPTYMNLKRLNHLLIRLGRSPFYNSSASGSLPSPISAPQALSASISQSRALSHRPSITGLYIKSLLDAVFHVQTLYVWREKKTGGGHLIDIQ